jgi:NAD(P)-dependent dehydrogenase (short-subunit alcohol dehydrogenase family)
VCGSWSPWASAWSHAGDLSQPGEAERLFNRVLDEFGGLDIFVGNAGIWEPDERAVASCPTSSGVAR